MSYDDLVRRLDAIGEEEMYQAPATTRATIEEAMSAIERLQAELAEAVGALETINRKASPDPERTMSEASNDLYWCACEARRVLAAIRERT